MGIRFSYVHILVSRYGEFMSVAEISDLRFFATLLSDERELGLHFVELDCE